MTKLYGITHDKATGESIVRVPRLLKIGIGVPRGPGIHTWIQWDERREKLQWVFRCYAAAKQGDKAAWFISKTRIDLLDKNGESNRVQAEDAYRQLHKQVAECKYPQKISYFTFTRPVIIDKTEVFEPDFEAIEKHGPMPTSIDIVLMDDEPLRAEYAMWSTSELKCHGDGLNALRVLSMADKETAAQYAGERFFPITTCACGGCEYFAAKDGKPAACKPSADLSFHLLNDIRIGGTAYFHTSGYRSISYLYSSLEQLRQLTGGRLRGVPVRMSLRAYKTKHEGQVATQYGVWLEFRAENVAALRKNLIQAAMEFRTLAPAPRQIEAPVAASNGADEEAEEVRHSPQTMTAEFYPEAADEGPDEEEESPKAATEAKGEALKRTMQSVVVDADPVSDQTPKPAEAPKSEPAKKPATRELF